MTSIAFDHTSASSSSLQRAFQRLTATTDSWGAMALRLVVGLVLLPHGAQKLFGLFGGYGFNGTMGYFTSLGIPYVFGVLAIAVETLGALALLFGVFTRLAAFGVAVNMTVAALMVHLPNGFFANWFGNQKGEGVEYFILAVTLALTVLVMGGGRYSVDRKLSGQN